MTPIIKKEMKPEDEKLVLELYEWLREKQLTAKQAMQLLNRTEQVVFDTRSAAADSLKI